MGKSRSTMELLDACRSPIRRQIMVLAEEARQAETHLTIKKAFEALDGSTGIGSTSYHVNSMAEAGLLEKVGGERIRGAYQAWYAPSAAFQVTLSDTVALDQIAEFIEGLRAMPVPCKKIAAIIRTTGRPVEA